MDELEGWTNRIQSLRCRLNELKELAFVKDSDGTIKANKSAIEEYVKVCKEYQDALKDLFIK